MVPTYLLVSRSHTSEPVIMCRSRSFVSLSVVPPRKCLPVQKHILSNPIRRPWASVTSRRFFGGLRVRSIHSRSTLFSSHRSRLFISCKSWLSVISMDRLYSALVWISPLPPVFRHLFGTHRSRLFIVYRGDGIQW